jgi:hypothetical protein
VTSIPRGAESFHEVEIDPVDPAPPRWQDARVSQPRAWLMILAFVLALGSHALRADAQAFKPRSKTGLPKRPVAAAVAPATPAPATPRKAVAPARAAAAKKAPPAKKKGGDDDDVVVVDDEDEE